MPGFPVGTTTYGGQLPGPTLRATVGRPMIVDIHNETDTPEWIRWHGQSAPADAHGRVNFAADALRAAWPLAARAVTRVALTPKRAGVYFYHSDAFAATRLDTGLYSGQFGALLVDSQDQRSDGGSSDQDEQERVVILKTCQPYIHRTSRGFDIAYRSLTINGIAADAQGVPLQVEAGRSLLLHVLNGSATMAHRVELPGHSLEVVALDGNPVPTRAGVTQLYLSPGERVSVRVRPGHERVSVVCKPATDVWDYTRFGAGQVPEPDASLDLVLERHPAARSGFNRWTLNGKSFSLSNPTPMLSVRSGRRYRLLIRNTSDEIIPLHLAGHLLEIVRAGGRPTAGVRKDVVAVGPRAHLEVDFVTEQAGRALLYCTQQLHKDFGLMGVVDYT